MNRLLDVDEALEARMRKVRLMIFDVDGVLTDGRIIYHDDGSETKVFDVQDGHGMKMLQRAGIEIALITGRFSKAVERRAENLGIARVHQNAHRKLEAYAKILDEGQWKDEEVGFMGDDLIDIPVMRQVGFAVAVPNASPHVLPYAHYVTQARGGYGACREVCEMLLQTQGQWEELTRRYWGTVESVEN